LCVSFGTISASVLIHFGFIFRYLFGIIFASIFEMILHRFWMPFGSSLDLFWCHFGNPKSTLALVSILETILMDF